MKTVRVVNPPEQRDSEADMVNREHAFVPLGGLLREVDRRAPIRAFLEVPCASTLVRIIPPLLEYSHRLKYMSNTRIVLSTVE